jgi:hypothetical protein
MIAEVQMKHGEVPWFLMWLSALLFAFGMVWAWLVGVGAAKTVTILDMPVRAAILIGARDARAVEVALDAARRLMALHKMQAASDVLLDLIAAGFRDREAQRLLIEVNCELGHRDTAREKCQLLGVAYRLDGQGAVAEDVERLAAIL